uniref:ATP synthase complex subunit 8 n=1 Tax=Agrilus biguttatus TaxID=324823 RepID=A0A0S2MQ13_9COLE|nr:ATP synthase F0 subunit 8 [Agrilus biguttatus]
MPQMAPMSWLSLFIIFSITFSVISMFNYYFLIYQPTLSTSQKKLMPKNNWKW